MTRNDGSSLLIAHWLPNKRDAAASLILTGVYWLAAVAGLQWTVAPGVGSALWPASGIALAALLLWGPRLWPAIVAGRFLAAMTVASPQPWWADAAIAVSTALGALVPALLIHRGGAFDKTLGNLGDAVRLVVVGGLGGALLSGILAMLTLWASGAAPGRLPHTFAAWCLGFAVGVVVVAPLVLAWSQRPRLSRLQGLHLAACLLATAGLANLIFLQPLGGDFRTWHLLPLLIWTALAFSVRGVAPAIIIISGFALASVVLDLGPFSTTSAAPTARLFLGQQFIAVTAMTMLALASAAEERRGTARIARLEALRSAILDAALDCIITISDDDRVVEWNRACERVFGYSRGDAIGRDLADLIIPPRHVSAHREGLRRYLATGDGLAVGRRFELEARRADGAEFPVELAIAAIQVAGRPHFTAYLRDLTEQARAKAVALESEQRLRATYEHALAGIAEVSPEGRYLRVNERFCDLTGFTRAALLDMNFRQITHPEDLVAEGDRFARQMAGDIDGYTVEERYLHKTGHTLWVELSASRVVDGAGRVAYGIQVVHDVTARKRWEQQQRLLINELNHRVKNTLATVQSIVAQTTRSEGSAAEMRASIEGRLMALSQAHDVLTREHWESAELHDIVARATAPFRAAGEGRFRIQGPSIRVSPRQALALSMALHELATNAGKYGALTCADGSVAISWSVAPGEVPMFKLEWCERGGPVVTPPAARGFGSRLLERGVAQDLGGEVELEFAPAGVRYRVHAPLDPALSGPRPPPFTP